jgi:kinesin family protein C1
MEDVMRQSQGYSATLQSYNTSLQNDINQEKLKRQELERARDMLQAQVAEMGGSLKSLEQLMQFEKVGAAPRPAGPALSSMLAVLDRKAAGCCRMLCHPAPTWPACCLPPPPPPQAQVEKMQGEREASARDIAVLRTDLDAARADRERTQAEVERLQGELSQFRDAGGKSLETVEMLNHNKATLEAQLDTQRRWAAPAGAVRRGGGACRALLVAAAACAKPAGGLRHCQPWRHCHVLPQLNRACRRRCRLLDAMRGDLGLAREKCALAESLAESRGTQVAELKVGGPACARGGTLAR